MNKKTKGLVAGVAGGALLLGAGGTFALWSDSVDIDGGTITAGTLDVNGGGSFDWYDVSPDRVDIANHLTGFGATHWGNLIDSGFVDPQVGNWGAAGGPVTTDFTTLRDRSAPLTGVRTGDHWNVVPGDFMLGRTNVTVTGHGDNLQAEIRVGAVDGNGTQVDVDGELAKALGLHFVVLNATSGLPVGPTTPIGTSLRIDEFEDDGAATPTVAKYEVVIVGNFPKGVAQQNLMSSAPTHGTIEAVLESLQVRVDQVRPH